MTGLPSKSPQRRRASADRKLRIFIIQTEPVLNVECNMKNCQPGIFRSPGSAIGEANVLGAALSWYCQNNDSKSGMTLSAHPRSRHASSQRRHFRRPSWVASAGRRTRRWSDPLDSVSLFFTASFARGHSAPALAYDASRFCCVIFLFRDFRNIGNTPFFRLRVGVFVKSGNPIPGE